MWITMKSQCVIPNYLILFMRKLSDQPPPSSKVIFKSRECENKASKYGIMRKSSVINENDEEEFSI